MIVFPASMNGGGFIAWYVEKYTVDYHKGPGY